MIIYWGNK